VSGSGTGSNSSNANVNASSFPRPRNKNWEIGQILGGNVDQVFWDMEKS